MSGGYYDYAGLIDGLYAMPAYRDGLERMAADLGEHDANDVAQELTDLLRISQQLRDDEDSEHIAADERLNESCAPRVQALAPVLHALEWWQSGDYGRQQFEDALSTWRATR